VANPSSHLVHHLSAAEVVMAIEEEFGVEMTDDDADKIQTVEDAVAYVCGNPNAK